MGIRPSCRPVLAVAATLILIIATPAAAAPTQRPHPPTVQQQIDAQLAKAPGGKQISPTEVSYGNGTFVITFVAPANTSVGADCPGGWFCFYDRTGYGYPRGKLSSCGWQDLAWWAWNDRTESVHYNISTGSVAFINHTGAPDHSDDVVLFSVGANSRYRSDVAPYRNMADHVYRYC